MIGSRHTAVDAKSPYSIYARSLANFGFIPAPANKAESTMYFLLKLV